MPVKEHIQYLKAGSDAWRQWRIKSQPFNVADFNKAILVRETFWDYDLEKAFFHQANLRGTSFARSNLDQAVFTRSNVVRCDFSGACLTGADFSNADAEASKFCGANLENANLQYASCKKADFSGATLINVNLRWADLRETNLEGANLRGSALNYSVLVDANLRRANISDCHIYGLSAWGIDLNGATQTNLVITPSREPVITADTLEVAQFLYLLLKNDRLRHIIDSLSSKVVLILGRFAPKRKAVLDALRDELRRRDYLPVLFDFDKPATRNLTETVATLAHMARFVVADITDAKSIPQELAFIAPNLPSVPIQPLLLASESEYGMFEHFRSYPWVLEVFRYADEQHLLSQLAAKVSEPAEEYRHTLLR